MRTTLDIDDDVLNAAKELARRENRSAGQVVSRLLRDVLTGKVVNTPEQVSASRAVLGFRPFPATTKVITNDQINALRDETGV